MEDIRIEKITHADEHVYEQVRDLLRQLYPNQQELSFEKFSRVVQSTQVYVYAAFFGDVVVGTSTLAFYEKLCGNIWIIEDVVVDEAIRGKGIGKKLTDHMLAEARSAGAEIVDLTTRSEDARRFYIEKCGFIDKAEGQPFWGLRYTF